MTRNQYLSGVLEPSVEDKNKVINLITYKKLTKKEMRKRCKRILEIINEYSCEAIMAEKNDMMSMLDSRLRKIGKKIIWKGEMI